MRLQELRVMGLFGRFDHRLKLPADERVAIMIAPNGFGKTMILRMVNTVFTRPVRAFARMPFSEFALDFDDGSTLRVVRTTEAGPEGETGGADASPERGAVELHYTGASGKHHEPYCPDARFTESDLGFPIGMIEEMVPGLDQIGRSLWRDRRIGQELDLEDVLERYGAHLPIEPQPGATTPRWLDDLRTVIPVRLIDTERLTRSLPGRSVRHRRMGAGQERTVRRYSEALAEQVQQILSEYGSLSQSLDRTFPARLVEETDSFESSREFLRDELAAVELKRSELVEAGLLIQDEAWPGVMSVPNVDQLKDTHQGVLAVYVRDARQKLAVFDDVLAKVNTLKRIANQRFLHKQVSISLSGLSVNSEDGTPLELEMLSSGEQHELVLLYELLFMVTRGSHILIDEPELSLHVAWQEKFLGDIQEIAELSDFRVLMATHSPLIIGDRFDLTVELSRPR